VGVRLTVLSAFEKAKPCYAWFLFGRRLRGIVLDPALRFRLSHFVLQAPTLLWWLLELLYHQLA
jgi:hypothetical protein